MAKTLFITPIKLAALRIETQCALHWKQRARRQKMIFEKD